jgi:hypothetical protein
MKRFLRKLFWMIKKHPSAPLRHDDLMIADIILGLLLNNSIQFTRYDTVGIKRYQTIYTSGLIKIILHKYDSEITDKYCEFNGIRLHSDISHIVTRLLEYESEDDPRISYSY